MTEYAPTIRGLKQAGELVPRTVLLWVTEYAPTIRGLKLCNLTAQGALDVTCDGIRPDNQGIETCSVRQTRGSPQTPVTEYAPTIRGLKRFARCRRCARGKSPRDGIRPDNQGIETRSIEPGHGRIGSTVTEYAPTIRGLKRRRRCLGTHARSGRDGIRPDNQGIETRRARSTPGDPRPVCDGIRPDNQGIETGSVLSGAKTLPLGVTEYAPTIRGLKHPGWRRRASAARRAGDGIRPDNQGIETRSTSRFLAKS